MPRAPTNWRARSTRINRERRDIEGGMREQAMLIVESLFDEGEEPPPAICVFDPDFHEGVVGIVASRIKDKLHRPTFVFAASQAPGKEHELKGSGRSIPGFHLRDALDLVAKRHPGVLLRFGGHAMAAGCTVAEEHLDVFEQALAAGGARMAGRAPRCCAGCTPTGRWQPNTAGADLVDTLHHEVWGQGFAPPVFSEEVEIISQRLVGEKHLQLKLRHQGQPVDGIWFGHTEPLPARVKLAFRLDADEWQGVAAGAVPGGRRGVLSRGDRLQACSPTGHGRAFIVEIGEQPWPPPHAARGSPSVWARASCHIAYSRSPSIMDVLMHRPWPAISKANAASSRVGQ